MRICVVACALWLTGVPVLAATPESPNAAGSSGDAVTLPALIAQTRQHHPRLQALRAATRALEHELRPAGARPDPRLRFDWLNVPVGEWDLDSSPMSGRQLMLSQQFPWPGRLAASHDVARARSRVADVAADEAALQLVAAARLAYHELLYAARALAITERNRDLLEDFVRIAQTKYAVGSGRQADILKAQVSLSSLGQRLITLRAEADISRARLNALRGEPPGAPLTPIAIAPREDVPLDAAHLLSRALAIRPALKGLRDEAALWRAVEAQQTLAARPDLDVSVSWRQRTFDADPVEGADFLSAGIALRLPLATDRRERERAAAARQRQGAAEAQLEATAREIQGRLDELVAVAQMHRDKRDLLDEAILPQARQALTAAIAGYRVDHVDFLTLLDSQVTLQQFEIDRIRHQTDYEKTLASLEAVVGEELPR